MIAQLLRGLVALSLLVGAPASAASLDLSPNPLGRVATRVRIPALIAAVAPPLRLVATRGEVPNLIGPAITTTAQLRKIFRSRHYMGALPSSDLVLAFGNYAGNASGEALPGNATTVQATVECPTNTGVAVPVTFGGAASYTMADGEAIVLADPTPASACGLSGFTANAPFWIKSARTIASGGKMVRAEAPVSGLTGEGAIQCDPAVDPQLSATGALTTTNGCTSYTEVVKPLAILGHTATAQVSVAGVGDSIMYRLNDAIGDGVTSGGGWFQRAMANVAGSHVPYVRMAIPSERAQGFVAGTRRQQLFAYVTHVLVNYGTNDLGAARSASLTIADLRTIWTAAKAAGVQRVEQVLILPRTTSTDSWATLSGQTPTAGFEASSPTYKSGLNAAIVANVGANGLDGFLDLSSVVADSGSPEKWAVTGVANAPTADGLHPASAGHVAMGNALVARIQSWMSALVAANDNGPWTSAERAAA